MSSYGRPLCVALGVSFGSAHAADWQVWRSKYLLSIISCGDCHTPGVFLGKPDATRYLGGSDVGFEVPGLGVFYGSNLTLDEETALAIGQLSRLQPRLRVEERPTIASLLQLCRWRPLRISQRQMPWRSPPI